MFSYVALALLAIPGVANAEPPSTMPSEAPTIVLEETLDPRATTLVYALMWGQDVALVDKIVSCESGYDPTAKNASSSASGMFQILKGTWEDFDCQGDVFDLEDNLACGMKILSTSGKQHWEQCL